MTVSNRVRTLFGGSGDPTGIRKQFKFTQLRKVPAIYEILDFLGPAELQQFVGMAQQGDYERSFTQRPDGTHEFNQERSSEFFYVKYGLRHHSSSSCPHHLKPHRTDANAIVRKTVQRIAEMIGTQAVRVEPLQVSI